MITTYVGNNEYRDYPPLATLGAPVLGQQAGCASVDDVIEALSLTRIRQTYKQAHLKGNCPVYVCTYCRWESEGLDVPGRGSAK